MPAQISPAAGRGGFVGTPRNRVDGPAKVTGTARYAGEFFAPDLAHGYVVTSTIARGRIAAIDATAAEALPGVIKVLTHENRPALPAEAKPYRDAVAPPGVPLRPLYDETVAFFGQPVALVVAEDFETARHAANLVAVSYEAESPRTDLAAQAGEAYVPPKKRAGIAPPHPPRGDAAGALERSEIRVSERYRMGFEHHNPMEPHASTIVVEGDGSFTVYDKIQGVSNSQAYLCAVFGLKPDRVRVLDPYFGGGFGSGLRPQFQLPLAMLAAQDLNRSVRVVLARDQMWSFTHRPSAIQTLSLGAGRDGGLNALRHEVLQSTSTFEDYQENIVNWGATLYACDNIDLGYRLAKLDLPTPGDMRAPGAVSGLFALECAMDELAYATGIDPVALRLKNYTESDPAEQKPFSSKALRQCYEQGAERFGWGSRNPEPRSMREGRELVGWGMATGIWEALMMQSSARAVLSAEGRLEVGNSTGDLGTGTYTILAQIAADTLGLPMEHVSVKLGDTRLAQAPVAGGSWTAASSGTAVMKACRAIAEEVLGLARGLDGSPLANADVDHVVFADGRIAMTSDPSRSLALSEVMEGAGRSTIEATGTGGPDKDFAKEFEAYTHSAIFAEVRVDEELGIARATRIVSAVAAGKILNPMTARSQIMGAVVMGIGSALHEDSMLDHRLGRFMNRNLGEYHVPSHADIHEIEVIFVEEADQANPLGVKGVGEIGIVGTAAAIANAVYHATGKRIRDLPITIDKILG